MLYRAARPILFAFEPETAHRLAFRSLDCLDRLGAAAVLATAAPRLPTRVMGLDFPNPVGLAAGLDKNGEHVDALGRLGFGFLEIGAVTLRPQPGNSRPRMFRLPAAEALINRMGFNNAGADRVARNLAGSRYRGVLGVNIGRNFDTPNERAAEEYAECLAKLYPHASFFTANVSSPNTKGLRELQQTNEIDLLFARLARERDRLAAQHGRRAPLAVKVSPDLEDSAVEQIADRVLAHGIDAVIATNTTVSRAGIEHLPHADEAGGLSGPPMRARSTQIVAKFRRVLPPRIAIVGVGGIASARDAREKLDAGADLVQLYTALLYRGPRLAGEIVRGLAASGWAPRGSPP